jgi:hypothetical protein
VTFTEAVPGPDGVSYLARACGGEMDDGRWQGWLEFEATDGSGIYRSRRETTQPNRTDLAYWATGLTAVYLEGAIERTLRPGPVVVKSVPPVASTFDEPLPPARPDEIPATEAVLNPFSVVRKGEAHLRQQLRALAAWHLVNIVQAYELSPLSSDALNLMSPADLIELIVAAVRQDTPVSR